MRRRPVKPATLPAARLAGTALALAGLAGLAGCGSLRATAPPTSRIEGTWRLDGALSDDVSAHIQQLIAAQEQKMRAQRRARAARGEDEDPAFDDGPPDGGDVPDDSGGGGSGGRGGAGGRSGRGDSGGSASGLSGRQGGANVLNAYILKELRSQLQLALTAPGTLGIDRTGETVRIAADGLPPRGYQPGDTFSRIDEIGTARVDSGWDGAAFVLKTRYTNRVERIERYELDARTDRLIITRTMNEPRTGKLALRSVYERG